MMQRLEIENFRGLTKLTIEGLARVNVFVGANNVGKTSVLEAIYLLQETGVSNAPSAIMQRRRYVAKYGKAVLDLFQAQGTTEPIQLRAAGSTGRYSVALSRAPKDYKAALTGRNAEGQRVSQTVDPESTFGEDMRLGRLPAVFFDFASLQDAEVAERIGELIVKRRRDRLISALKRVDPRVVGVDQYKLPGTSTVEAWVDLGLPERMLQLTQAGHGLRYATALFSEVDRARDALILIDEIEVGLYHDVITPVWQTLDGMSRDNKLQLFVTTHSYECLQAADKAMAEHPEDLAVFRLERLPDGRLAVFRLGPAEREAVFHYKSEVR